MNILDNTALRLNCQQQYAADWEKGPVLIIAGAGTGKTRVLVNRVANLVKKGVDPSSILILTFTKRAAKEMLNRAALMLEEKHSIKQVSGGTFHSFANKIIRKHCGQAGIARNYTILDRADSADVIDIVREEIGISRKDKRFPFKKTLEKIINLSKNKDFEITQIIDQEYPQFIEETENIEKIAKRYQEYKAQNNLLDYNDLLIYLKIILEKNPEITKNYQYVMVDEFQDTNKIQGYITYLLGKSHKNVMVVGDDTQSIYSFRGANFKNMFDFKQNYFPEAKIVKLEENYRSTQPILNLANGIIENAVQKYTKALYTKKTQGHPPVLISSSDEESQAEIIANMVLTLNNEKKIPLKEIAVLFRASYHAIPLEIELAKNNISYVKHGGFKFFETAHVKDIIAYLKVIENYKDEIAWNRILTLVEGIGKVTSSKIRKKIINSTKPYKELANSSNNTEIKRLSNMFMEVKNNSLLPAEKIEIILKYYNPVLRNKFDDFPKRKEDLNQLQYMAGNYSSLENFLTDLSLEPPNKSVAENLTIQPDEENTLCLSTIHSAKGLEWNTVFIMDLVDGRFPLTHYMYSYDFLEEERRLFYVACTRAKVNLYLFYPIMTRNNFNRESEFIPEIEHFVIKRDLSSHF